MNIGVYITLLNDEYILPFCLAPIMNVFPQAKVLDFGSTDSSCSKVPANKLIKHGKIDPVDYITLKNDYSKNHDQVFWVDADEVYPIPVLNKLKDRMQENPDQIATYWRNVMVKADLSVYVEQPFVRGTACWRPLYNRLVRAWPNERLEYLLDIKNLQVEHNPELFCWHGVLLNRSSVSPSKSRYKKRADRYAEALNRATWALSCLPWPDKQLKKYVPIEDSRLASKRPRN
jgi:hypothetical protein